MKKLSVILATYNEQKNIKDFMESVKALASEIVVVDGSSTDKTVQIAKKFTSKVFVRENPLMFHVNKQFAIDKATGDWILYLDADERVTPELAKEIKEVLENPKDTRGYWIPRKNIIFGKWIEHTGWYPDFQLRLFRKGAGRLPCKSVHEQPVVTGKTGYLQNPIIHHNYQTVSQYLNKLNNLYTENDKNVLLKKGEEVVWSDAIRFPLREFLKRFFAEEGYRDGLHGLMLSILQAFSAFVTFAKLWESKGFPQCQDKNFLKDFEAESKTAVGEMKYWLLTSNMNLGNPAKKVLYKLRRKLSK